MVGGSIRDIPIVGQFLIDGKILGKLEDLQDKYKLSVDRAIEYLTLTRAVLDGEIELGHMPEMIAEAFGVDEATSVKIACDVAGIRLLPLENYFPGVGAQIEKWGGKVSDYSAERVGKEKITADRFAGNLTENLELTLSPVHIKRLAFLAKSYVAGEKTRDATMTFFARPVNIGGLGLALEQAKTLMESIDDAKDLIEFVDDSHDETFQEEDSEEAQPVELSSMDDSRPTLSVGGVNDVSQEVRPVEEVVEPVVEAPVIEEKKVEEVKSTMLEIVPTSEVSTTTPIRIAVPKFVVDEDKGDIVAQAKEIAKKDITDVGGGEKLKAAIDLAVSAASTLLQEKRMAKKDFAGLAEKMIRGVRDEMQTRGVLINDFKLDDGSVDKMAKAINEGVAMYHRSSLSSQMAKVEVPKTEIDVRPTASEVMDQRFAEVTKTLPKAPIVPVLPEARVSAARSKDDEVAGQAAKIDQAKIEVAQEAAKPMPAKAMLTLGSVPPQLPGEQPVMSDVKFKSKLVGPVDELGTMMPADFRRLSSDPAEAVQKIEDLLLALQTTSYEERIKGIQAWRVSPVCKLYVAMAGEALQAGVALAEVASKRRNKGEESLSPAEMKAIGSLNSRMRF